MPSVPSEQTPESRGDRTGGSASSRLPPTAWLASIIESADDAIISTQLDGTIVSWNAGAERLFGYTAAEAAGQPITILIPPELLHEETAMHQRICQGEPVKKYETIRRRKDGSLVEISLTVSPIRGPDDRILGASRIAREISDKRRAEETGRRLASIVESSDDAILSKDLDGVIQSWNPGAERLFGYTADEAVGRPVTMLMPLDRQDEEPEILRHIRRGERIERFDTVRRRKDGTLIDVSLTVSPVRNAAGRVIGASKIVRDITERRRNVDADRRLAAIVESSEDAIVSKNLDGIIQSWNVGAERLFGYSAAEIIGQPVLVLIPEGRHDEEPAILERLRRGERIEHYETIRRRKDGALIEVSLTVSPIFDGAGRVIGASKIARDITSQKRVQRELQEAHEKAIAANRAKDDFLAALSHELRTPLNPVLLTASAGSVDQTLPECARADFESIRKNIELEARLIDDLLDVARITRGKLPLNTAIQNIHDILRDAIATIQPELEAKQQTLTCNIAPTALTVSGDAVRLQQVLWNVLKNAVKFTPERGQITVSTRINPSRQCAVIEIADSGVGLARDELERIFDAFAQVEQPGGGVHRFGGLGLGLTISRLITELHRGSIHAISEGRGRGATFVIELPLGHITNEPTDNEAGPQRTGRSDERQDRAEPKKRLLLVEDHESSRTALVQLFSRRGFEVVGTGSVKEARDAASREPFDLAICDIGLPDGDGVELIAELQRLHGLRSIALTGFGMEQDIRRCYDAGAFAHLTKPVSIQALDQVLSTALAVKA